MSDMGREKVKSSALFERGLLSEFSASVLPNNINGATAIPLATTPTTLAALANTSAIRVNSVNDRVWLTGTVGWRAVTPATVGRVDVMFRIWRTAPITGTLIFSTLDSAAALDIDQTTSFIHVDLTPVLTPGQHIVPYYLTAELPLTGSAATIIGPITFTAAEIEPNRCGCP
ncbi:hypothetical protein [Desulforamulus ruminis]|uniref:Uncharacterized protein n=1 Tax=Desulforamulus ruminis (strain ATCC 23193 / DSM 2154 / NCIMB 8452 / DL) TaxID=696281 RepID=F6DL56_DESRL|nr:hypothetical protein [Desulforamulus ruminis]AEG59277.1 hypothetical protein Desru_1002 [Desulforamulus ruminis DSM 2154]